MGGVPGAPSSPLSPQQTGMGWVSAEAPVRPHGVHSSVQRLPKQGVTPAAMPGEAPPPPWASRVLSGAVFIDLSKRSDVAGCASPSSD